MKLTTKYVGLDVHQATTVASVPAPRTRRHRKASSSQQSGLIAKERTAKQSATTRSALDYRSHRTH
jgi:hypothetical protein